ncbi:bZIP transcription factor 39-like [Zingiber officinale]|uniref:bZIP transcription factor 39-like n=1 Tax=Zingiber officinale TaxID=94328 RepID=UPI001C4CE054|nr:bZIP transcription factor 39-like [Zingiber officinale]
MADPSPPSAAFIVDPFLEDLAAGVLPLSPSDDFRDLDLDFVFDDFSVDDYLCLPEDQINTHLSSNASPGPRSQADGSDLSFSPSRKPDLPNRPSDSDSGDSSAASGVFVVDREVKSEKAGWSFKRKMKAGDETFNGSDPNSNFDSNPRSTKLRRSEESSPCVLGSGAEEDEKRRARMMRNRESAQLSRQRKKQHVGELEDKLRAMHSTINELNSKISYLMAENASLRQQIGGGGATPLGYPPPGAFSPLHFPWIPGYALKPQGSQVPLVPIPRLKPQLATPAPKAKKSESKKSERKTTKMASVSLIGLFLTMLMVCGALPGINIWKGGNEVDLGHSKYQILEQTKGRILNVRGRPSALNNTREMVTCNGKQDFRGDGGVDRITGTQCEDGKVTPGLEPKRSSPWPLSPEAVASQSHNSSENLPALLYVPRNGKHVEINGNLIIHSVLASEKAMQQAKARHSSQVKETGLAVSGKALSPFSVANTGKKVDQQTNSYKTIDSDNTYASNLKSTSADGALQQWFQEGMTGSILSSGMCTEVFQFEVSPSSSSGGVIPTSSIINASSTTNASENLPPSSSHRERVRSRRMMYSDPIPLRGTTTNNTEQLNSSSSESSKFHNTKPAASSVVVSILADPREAGDGENDGRVSPNSLSRIFVVVLMDSVKYVTYSCVLPFKTSIPHLVN